MLEKTYAHDPYPVLVSNFKECFLFYRDILGLPVTYGDENGILPLDQPQDRKDWGIRCFHTRDPAGILIEVFMDIGMALQTIAP
jgi:catechol 2,3-dioxygenase-like lactoylglutathione lyase family enzyme